MCQKKNHQTKLTVIVIILAVMGVLTIGSIGIFFIIAAIVVMAKAGGNKKAWDLLTLNGRHIHPSLLGHERKNKSAIDVAFRDVTDSEKQQNAGESANDVRRADIEDRISKINCPKCGKTVDSGSKFCSYCGASIQAQNSGI